jgi:mono/diheme cytochrome c family protein
VNVLSCGRLRGLNVSLWKVAAGLVWAVWMMSVVLVTASSDQTAAAKTTKARVYSAAQATRGEALYMSMCVSCHPPATYTGAVFLTWQGRNLGELLAFLQEKMPKNDPGNLTAKEYADVMAYLLKLNKMPAGRVDLPADAKTLRGINIDILP